MPVEFLTEAQQQTYGRFAGEPTEAQLARYLHLDHTDHVLIRKRRGVHNRLGFALQLTTVRFLGTFLPDPTAVPSGVLAFVAHQLAIIDSSIISNYLRRKATRYSHSAEIQQVYGYADFAAPPWRFRFIRLLYSRAWISPERPSLLFDYATAWLVQHKVWLPGATTLARLIAEIRERATHRLYRRLASLPSTAQKARLETLCHIPDTPSSTRFEYYRTGPTTISGLAFNQAVERYQELRAFGFQHLDLSHIPPVRLQTLARHAGLVSRQTIARRPEEKRSAFLVAFVKAYEIMALDDALDLLDALITHIAGETKKLGQKKRLRTLRDLDQSALTLADVCSMLVGEEPHDVDLRAAIFAHVFKAPVQASIATIRDLARSPDDYFHEELVAPYGKVQRFLPQLLNGIAFSAAPAGATTLEALQYLAALGTSRKQLLEQVPRTIITKPWHRLVFDTAGRVLKRGYTLCLLATLQDRLRRRVVYVEHSDRWGDPRAKLLQGEEWQVQRAHVCRSLGHPAAPTEALTNLAQPLDAIYQRVASQFEANQAVQLDPSGKHPSLTITNLDKLEEPPSLLQLRAQVTELLPPIDLPELLLEIHTHTGFAHAFSHVSEATTRADDLTTSLCAMLLAEACNIGFAPLIKPQVPVLTKHRLKWVKQNYVRADTLIRANTCLVDYQSTRRLVQTWGVATLPRLMACALSRRYAPSMRDQIAPILVPIGALPGTTFPLISALGVRHCDSWDPPRFHLCPRRLVGTTNRAPAHRNYDRYRGDQRSRVWVVLVTWLSIFPTSGRCRSSHLLADRPSCGLWGAQCRRP
ncbi:MAG: Tn3 family transposase [Chloroflexi bacterium AL-W]|nr:Tn3 family transposase [Chloroflexi bacterium AL-N1]NOK67530.1 Tn3 family transposase [Chloroflexi bacterium AL-N10]NOK74978.1 Tn3 family transposase [Chloroflexi bacterium AL-N5]NOK81765.1 Tn3 family transposase [Chloroflexi bacterium AL-W]NOK89611.1 Tn3 family transposase [Chloroflexi bacterium AL-N15]